MVTQSAAVPGFSGWTGGTETGNRLISEPDGGTGTSHEEL